MTTDPILDRLDRLENPRFGVHDEALWPQPPQPAAGSDAARWAERENARLLANRQASDQEAARRRDEVARAEAERQRLWEQNAPARERALRDADAIVTRIADLDAKLEAKLAPIRADRARLYAELEALDEIVTRWEPPT